MNMDKMDVDDTARDSAQSPTPRSPGGVYSDDEDSLYQTPNDVLIYDKNLVCPGTVLKQYPMSKPIGYAVLLGSDRNPSYDAYSEAIRNDLSLMKTVMRGLEWEVHSPCQNESTREVTLTSNQWVNVMGYLESKSSDFKQYSSFLLYFSGHGVSDRVILSDRKCIEYEEMISRVSKIPSLKHKPKIFIFDCCRTFENYDEDGESHKNSSSKDSSFGKEIQEVCSSLSLSNIIFPPTETMVCFSASEGTKGWMEKQTGSIFTLQFAHSLLQFNSQLSLGEIVTHVIGGTVQIARQALNMEQRPVFYSTMTRTLILSEQRQSKCAVYRESAHSEQLEPFNVKAQPQNKGPYLVSKGGQASSDVVKDAVTVVGHKVTKKSFTSRQDVESRLSQLGEGVSVFIVYAPDPESPYFDPRQREAQINLNERLVFNLAYDLERHGFHVVTDLHLGDTQPTNWLQWYTSRISMCDFVILVCSPAFNELFSHDPHPGSQILDHRAQLLLSYRNAVYSEITTEVQSGGKFIPVVLHSNYWTVDECVPGLFRAGTIYEVPEEQEPRRFTYADQTRWFEKLVCRMAGINRMELDKSPVVGVHQLGRYNYEGGEFDRRKLLEAAKKPKKGFKIVKPGQLPSSGSAFQGFSAAAPHSGFSSHHATYMQQAPPLPVGHVQMPPSQIQHPAVPLYPTAPAAPVAAMDPSALPDKEPSQSVILWLSQKMVSWKMFGRFLGLENHDLDRIEIENPGDVTEQCFRMLDTWRVQRSSPYNYRTLGEQLLKSEGNRTHYPEFVKKVTETESI